jgi:hypothetical protein
MSKLEVREIGPISGETEVKIGQSGGIVRIEQDCQFILGYPVTSGGVKTQTGEYTVHTFTSSGVFEVVGDDIEAEYLVIAGGGGGGGYALGAGGGAGGYRCSVPGEMSGGNTPAETPITLSAGSYPVIIGAGGHPLWHGGDSSFAGIVSIGGGHGYTRGLFGSGQYEGGSGSGGINDPMASTQAGFAGTVGQGHAGATVVAQNDTTNGGGGGAGSIGGKPGLLGAGGDGLQSSIDGTPTYRAGGGGGGWSAGMDPSNPGGLGGGGNGNQHNNPKLHATSGTPSTGSGGGGDASTLPENSFSEMGFGGSGIVIVRYKS